MKPKLVFFSILSVAILSLTIGSYFLFKKILKDRQLAAQFNMPISRNIPINGNRQVTTYTAEDLEKMRKEGKLPQNAVPQPYIPPNNYQSQNDAAVQRSLRTLEEINRTNELNQRLMEQQRQMQNQK
ncbi:MAG: hypothetical protein ACKVQC_07380 [Elusimicrobiota bacterium]